MNVCLSKIVLAVLQLYICSVRCKALLLVTASLRSFGVRFGDVTTILLTVCLGGDADTCTQSPTSSKTAPTTKKTVQNKP